MIAVTGASGFVGREMVKALHAGRRTIRVLDARRFDPRALEGCEAVIHLAALAHSRGIARDELQRVNVDLPVSVGRAATAAGARMIFVSTVKVHGEQTAAPLTEDFPLAPKDGYGESKARAEEALRAIAGLSLTVLRPPLVYGAGVRANFLALLRAVEHGWPLPLASIRNRRSLIYVGNLVDAVVRSLATQGTFLVSDGPAVATPDLCRELAAALGRRARLFRFPPSLLPRKLASSLEVDDSAIRKALGWQPPFSRQAGLSVTARWYQGRT